MPSEKNVLDLNSADRKLLTQLPGVSKTVSYKIVNFRAEHGGFSDWTGVEEATGISGDDMAALRNRAFIGPRYAVRVENTAIRSRRKSKLSFQKRAV